MVGRTPEYLGKKIGAREIKFAVAVLPDHAGARADRHRARDGHAGHRHRCSTPGPHGLSEVALRVHLGRQQQRLRVRRPDRRTPTGTTPRSGWRCCSAGSCRSCSSWPGRFARQAAADAGERGHAAHPQAAVRRHARRRHRDPGRPDLLPRARPRPARGGLADIVQSTIDVPSTSRTGAAQPAARPRRVGGGLLDPRQLWTALPGRAAQAGPAQLWPTRSCSSSRSAPRSPPCWRSSTRRVRLVDRRLAVADRASSPTWPRRSPRAAARPRPPAAPGQAGDHGPPPDRLGSRRIRRVRGGGGRRHRAAAGRHRGGRGRARPSPATATSSRASPPSTSRRSPASPRRSSASRAATARPSPAAPRCCPTGSSCGSPPKPGETLHRPDDRAGRRRGAAEDAERDRAEHPARGADDHLPARRGHAAADGDLAKRSKRRHRTPLTSTASPIVLVALLVCLIPTTIGALLSAIGIAGMDRLVQRNVLAMSGRAVEAAGDVNTLLLDKTGTITLGNRQAAEFLPVDGVDRARISPTPPSCRRWPTRPRRAAPSCAGQGALRAAGAGRGVDAARRRSCRSPRRPG